MERAEKERGEEEGNGKKGRQEGREVERKEGREDVGKKYQMKGAERRMKECVY